MRHPTIAELRTRVHKGRHREIGNWMARHIARPTAVYGTWAAVRLGLSAHQVTLLALVFNGLAGAAIASGNRWGFVGGVLCAHLAFWLDRVDGQVARWRETVSLSGVYFDYLMHHAAGAGIGFGLGYGLAAQGGDLRWTLAGFAIAAGWTALSLHNDSRYKAMFQRLKSASGSFRVDGGGAERPAPPAPWPRTGRAALTWPAYKACEFHVVLMTLSALAIVAAVAPPVWMLGWQGYVGVMACLAPALAVARIARAVMLNSVDGEFARWFQPWPENGPSTPVSRLAPGLAATASYDEVLVAAPAWEKPGAGASARS